MRQFAKPGYQTWAMFRFSIEMAGASRPLKTEPGKALPRSREISFMS